MKKWVFLSFCVLIASFDLNLYSYDFERSLSKNKVNFHYFLRYDYLGGYAANGWLDEAKDNGKIYIRPSLTGFVGAKKIIGSFSLGAGYDYADVSSLKEWDKTHYEKDFKFKDKSVYIGIGFDSFQKDESDDALTLIQLGRKYVELNPPVFNSAGIDPSKLAEKEAEFNSKNSVWEKRNGWGWMVGVVNFEKKEKKNKHNENGDKLVSTKNFWSVSVFEADKKFGIHIKVREDPPYVARINIPLIKDSLLVGYISPLNIISSFEFLWWKDVGWRVNFSILGIYL